MTTPRYSCKRGVLAAITVAIPAMLIGSALSAPPDRNGSEIGSATSTSYTDSGLSAKTSYTYAATAVSPAGESAQSSAVTATSPDTGSGAIPAPV